MNIYKKVKFKNIIQTNELRYVSLLVSVLTQQIINYQGQGGFLKRNAKQMKLSGATKVISKFSPGRVG